MGKHSEHLLTELNAAIAIGFIHHFRISSTGLLHLLGTSMEYAVEKVSIRFKHCIECGWTLYFITTNDDLKGTSIEFHSDF